MFKKLVFLAVVAVVLAVLSTGMATADVKTATSNVTVTVPAVVSIETTPLPDMTISVVDLGVEATGTISFTVKTNVPTSIAVGAIIQPLAPSALTGLSGSLSLSSTPAADTPVILTGKITVPTGTAPGSYTGGSITINVTYSP
jgi:hypothetical protein